MKSNTGNLYRYSSLGNTGRKAGMGMNYDDYSDESTLDDHKYHTVKVRMPHDGYDPKELNGPVICYKGGKMKVMKCE